MASSAGRRNDRSHVLNFFYDNENGCALTVLIHGVRFHIIVDQHRLQNDSGSRLIKEFDDLLTAVKHQDQDFTRPSSKENLRSSTDPESQDSHDSGHGTTEDEGDDDEQDSAVDVSENRNTSKSSAPGEYSDVDPETALHNWMLKPFNSIFEEKAPISDEEEKQRTVTEWYDRPSFFFTLENKKGKLEAVEEEATPDLERRMKDIIPKLPMPKYIRNLDIPWYSANDLTVLTATDEPGPYHPSRVRIGEETFFLKTVDPTQPQPTKREINIAKEIEKKGLHKQIRVPLVKGLVGYEESHVDIIGFLQTDIEDPTPLTKLIDEDIPQAKRDKWAKEAERIKEILHENNIIWGDAKADNFMVDKHDELWIIDFGGSYTEGWVDPELNETQEGDNMGVDKIVSALDDPVANTCDPNEPDRTLYQISSSSTSSSPNNRKRKAAELEDDDTTEDDDDDKTLDDTNTETSSPISPRKRARKDNTNHEENNQPKDTDSTTAEANPDTQDSHHCICNKQDSGDMICCDSNNCSRQWYHFECVGLKEEPRSKYWYCEDCV